MTLNSSNRTLDSIPADETRESERDLYPEIVVRTLPGMKEDIERGKSLFLKPSRKKEHPRSEGTKAFFASLKAERKSDRYYY